MHTEHHDPAVLALAERARSVAASRISSQVTLPSGPGLYSWWADDEARAIIGTVLGTGVPAMI